MFHSWAGVMSRVILVLANIILVTVSQQSHPRRPRGVSSSAPQGRSSGTCPVNPSVITVNRNSPYCKVVKTRFCFRNNCRRCCYFQSSCNPYPGILVLREKCKNDLCGRVRCMYPGEYCDITKDNIPKCYCPESCPDDEILQRVCGTDGVTYASECILNKTACMLGQHISVKFSGPCDLQRRHLVVSPLHRTSVILEAKLPGKLLCSLLGDPISITWSKLEIDSLPPRMIPMKETLVIPQVGIADEGVYRCEAYDGSSVVEAFVNLTVEYDAENNGGLDLSKKPKSLCLLPRRYGYCGQHVVRWYFDVETRTCQPFVYSGCGRNDNNFKTRKQCKAACGHWAGDICKLPKRIGPCEAHIPRWYFDKDRIRCKKFIYGGCRGNANRFSSKLSCDVRCKAQKGLMSACIKLYMDAVRSHRRGLFTPQCTAEGNFQRTQCHESVCFCMDENGVELHGTRVPYGQHINCTAKVHQCRMARNNIQGNHFSGQHNPQCKQDGAYESVQCSPLTGNCWCVDATGYEMEGTRTRAPLTCPTMNAELTHCQRHYIDNSKSPHPSEFVTRCAEDGRYRVVQCRGNNATCLCVDRETGDVQSGTDISITLGIPQCQSSGGLTICQRMHQEAIKHPEMSEFIPQCTTDGRFEHVQCDSESKACWCVDSKGMEMVGSKVQGNIICPDIDSKLSPCQRRYQHAMKRLSYKINHHAPRCKADGSYKDIQCLGRTCHCVDEKGAEIPHTRVQSVARRPNCTHPDANLTPCEKARHVAMKTSRFVPRCKPDGSWQTVQCRHTTKQCWCLDENGKEIKRTRSRGPVTCNKDTKGQCWIKYVVALRSSRRSRRLPWCLKDGTYNPMQCQGSFCYCVMSSGEEIPGSKLSVALGKPNCKSSDDSLTQCQRHYYGAVLSGFMAGHVPRCKSNGKYEEVQCQAGTSMCWCVDDNGYELPGTRTTKDIKCPVIGGSLSPCQQMYLDYALHPSDDRVKPRCTPGGDFDPVQCNKLFCYCVDEKGNEIPNTRLRNIVGKPVCNREENMYLTKCQREVHQAQEQLPPAQRAEPRCKPGGRYEEVQCSRVSGQCWCVDDQGHEVAKTRTTGYVKCPSAGYSLTPCQTEYQDVLRRSLLPHAVPQCTVEGRYEPVQCREGYCYCVNDHGVEIAYSRVSSSEEIPNCQPVDLGPTLCQRQLQMYMGSEGRRQLEPSCNPDGSFRGVQCYGAQCYCVDSRGVEVQGTRRNFIDGKPNCEKKYLSLTPCQQHLQESILSLFNSSRFVPRCNKGGHFEPVQCNHVTGHCWCVSKQGKEIKYTRTKGTPHCDGVDLSPQCWRDYITTSNTSLPGSFTPWCTKNGAYEHIQTQGSRYFCVNDLGLEVLGTSVSVLQQKPNCKAAVSPGFIPSPCQREQIRQMYSPKSSGSYIPHCKTDGSYDEIQCDTSRGQCWCVDRDGQELDGMRTAGLLVCPSDAPLSRCQVEHQKSLRVISSDSSLQLFIPRCKSEGGFDEVQCHGLTAQCWCVDINGNEIIGSATTGRKPDCEKAAKMSTCDRNRVVAMGMTGKPGPGRYVPQCTHNGKYKKVQCHDATGLCWCADEEGHEIIGTRMWGHPQCQEMPAENEFPLDLAVLYPPLFSNSDLQALKTFLRSLVSSFDISPKGTHLSLVMFSEKAHSTLSFNSLQGNNLTRENINKIIDNIEVGNRVTRLDRGLQVADQVTFTTMNGMRAIASKALLVVMDKRQTRDQGRYIPLSIASEDLKSKCIDVFSIGIESQVDVDELLSVASNPVNVFTVDSFQSLSLHGHEVADVVRNGTNNVFTVEKQCNLPVQPGKRGCLASIPAWYYNSAMGQCVQFTYSGCGGNANSFATHEKCRKTCGGVLPFCQEVQRRQNTMSLGHYNPSCLGNGHYTSIQCYEASGYCWCTDTDGAERLHTRVQGTPVCSIPKGKTTPCLEERRKVLGQRGVPSIGRHAPECDSIGKYHAVQNNGNSEFRWCVDPEGYPVAGSQRWGKPNCTDVDRALRSHRKARTECERERLKSELIDEGRRLFKPKCTEDGNYDNIQCYGRTCWCVDHHGNEIIGTRQRGTPNCTAVASLTPCHREYRRSMILRGVTPLRYFLPQCKSNGEFELVQCHSATGYCWCVDETGNELVGTRQWGRPNCTNAQRRTVCHSRRDECQDNQPPNHFIPKCKDNGAFKELQCLESMEECWCVDHYGYEMAGTRTSSHYRPNCTLLAWLSPCQIERRKALGPDGLPVVGLFIPECRSGGSYDSVQCHQPANHNKVCWCVDSQGTEIGGSRKPTGVRPYCDKKRSLCKQQERKYLSDNSTLRFKPKCVYIDKTWKFAPSQCARSKDMPELCWCVDEYGNEIHSLSPRSHNCSGDVAGLTTCQHRHNEALTKGRPIVPRCNIDGSYASMQCSSKTNDCWCVDRYFNEKKDSRRPGQAKCESREDMAICSLPVDSGPCQSGLLRWYFNSTSNTCNAFIYGGCVGNENKFIDYNSCQEQCKGSPLTPCQLAKTLSQLDASKHQPSCKTNGSYKTVQCNNMIKQCWCVNVGGQEIVGTKTSNGTIPNCNKETTTGVPEIQGRKWLNL